MQKNMNSNSIHCDETNRASCRVRPSCRSTNSSTCFASTRSVSAQSTHTSTHAPVHSSRKPIFYSWLCIFYYYDTNEHGLYSIHSIHPIFSVYTANFIKELTATVAEQYDYILPLIYYIPMKKLLL